MNRDDDLIQPDPDDASLSDEELALLVQTYERTRQNGEEIEDALEGVDDNADEIQEVKGKVRRNTTVLSGITGGVGMIVMWAADKISRFT